MTKWYHINMKFSQITHNISKTMLNEKKSLWRHFFIMAPHPEIIYFKFFQLLAEVTLYYVMGPEFWQGATSSRRMEPPNIQKDQNVETMRAKVYWPENEK